MDHLAPRIISFGCSITNYIYPTYADILQADNRGQSGSGNERIFYTVLDAFKNKELENYDIIIVQWSSQYRFDYLTNNDWTFPDGNITQSIHNKHIWKKIKEWYNFDYEDEKTENYALTLWYTLKTLNKKIVYLSYSGIVTQHFPILINNIWKAHKGDYEFTSGMDWDEKRFIDDHPTIRQHYQMSNYIAHRCDIKLNPIVVKKAFDIENQIRSDKKFIERKL